MEIQYLFLTSTLLNGTHFNPPGSAMRDGFRINLGSSLLLEEFVEPFRTAYAFIIRSKACQEKHWDPNSDVEIE